MILYWDAWMELQTDRPQSMDGAGPIPFTSICTFAERYEFDDEDFDDLLFFLRRMEVTWAEWRDAKRKAPKPKKGNVNF